MPLTRYQIRNEYRLADPELYRAADKDDPEALLEGVAMAGLVGVLRQLGDLAEFAAEIFHNLHEEVMVTAARGHGLTLRVQQLEVEFLSIEKAFLSQTCHSPFLHNSGVDWHPNLKLDHSPITEEDLPRFVMDSYEDCRGPPRLFLLDKFDVAGAGACLKRYTDPSFFKAEFAISEATKEEHKREKKARKVRKKGSRWRTGDNPDVTASHSKLHQLLLEERCQSQINVPTHHVKLKRRLSSNSLIDSTSVKNYMEKLLNSDSPDTKLVCESSSNPSHLNMGSSDTSGLASDHQTQGRSPANKLVTGDINPIPSHSRDGKILKPSMAGSGVDIIEKRNLDSMVEPASEANFESIPSNFYKGEDRKTIQTAHTHVGLRAHTSDLTQSPHMQEPPALGLEDKFSFAVNGKGNTEAIAEGYHSDDGNSEIENYTDALTTMDSEVDTDTESRPKNERSLKTERKCLVSETDEVKHESRAAFPDSVSIGKAMISEDKNDLLEKRRLSSYEADTVSNSSEHLSSDGDRIAAFLPSTLSNAEVSSRRTYVISSQSRLGEAEIPHPDSIMITSNVVDSVAGQLSPRSENDESLGHDLSCVTNVSDIPFQSRHDSLYMGPQKGQTLELSDGRNDGSNGISSRLPDILGAPHEVKEVVKDAEDRASIGISDDSDAYQMNGKFDSPDSVLLNTETEVYDLAEQDQEARLGASRTPECRPHYPTDGDVEDLRTERTVVGSEEVQPSGETSEHLASVVACHETHESEQKEPEIRDQAASLESDMARVGTSDSEVEALCNNLESNISDSCGSEMGGSCNNVDFNKAYREVKEGHAPQIVQFNPDRERNSDLSLDTRKNISEAEPPFEVADSETTSNFPKIIGDIGVCHSPIGPMDGAVNKNYMEVIEDPSANYFTNSNSEVEVDNQLTSVLSDCNGSACNLEKNHLSSPMYDAQDLLMAESIQTHTDLTGDPEVTSSIKEGDQKKELKQHLPCASVEVIFSPSTSLIEPGALLEEEQKFPARVESDLHPDASNIQLLNPQPHVPVLDISVPDNNNAQGNVEEMPPLPPLPPMQWRIGKFQHDSPASRGELTVPSFNTSLPMLAEEADWIAQQGFPIFCGKLAQPVDSFLQLPTSNVNNPQMVKQMPGEEVVQTSWSPSVSAVPAIECQNVLMDHLYLPTTTEPLNPFSLLTDKDLQHDSSNAGEEMLQHTSLNMMGSSSSTDDLKSQRVSLTSEDNLEQSLDSLPLRQYREDQQMHHTLELEPSVENENIGHDSRTLEGELKWQSNSSAVVPTVDYGKPLGTLRSRLSRPRDPLIEAVASHDKSNLRKVTERIVPKIEPQPDERNSLLEQIRNKSFNLKPAVSMRPSVQGPKTNLKVVAILEKANAIRQALAGSDDDEDDEDSWSDS